MNRIHIKLLIVFFLIWPIFGLLTLKSISFNVEPSECSVIVSPFSKQPRTKGPGKRYTFPWNEVFIYDMSQDVSEQRFEILDKENNRIKITLIARFSPIRDQLPSLHNEIGENYKSTIVDPSMISTAAQIMSTYTAEEIWVTKRYELEVALNDTLKSELLKQHIDLKSLLIMSIDLPENVEKRIKLDLKFE